MEDDGEGDPVHLMELNAKLAPDATHHLDLGRDGRRKSATDALPDGVPKRQVSMRRATIATMEVLARDF